jgi:hypothetical protein
LSEPANVIRFIETANAFCALVESSGSLDQTIFFKDCFHFVSALLAEAVYLPDVGDLNPEREIPRDEYSAIVQRLKHQVGQNDSYKMFFDPWKDAECVKGSIWDDLADIWHDIKRGLIALDEDDSSEAICEWRFWFIYHWGTHATRLLPPLLWLVNKDKQD